MSRKIDSRTKLRSPRPPAVAPTAGTSRAVSTSTLLLCCAALVVLVIAAYANSTSNGFVWDDHQQIVLNENLRPSTPLARLFTTDTRFDSHSQSLQGVDYRPLQMLTYRLVLGAFGLQAVPFHIVSLLFAIACVLAAFFLARTLLSSTERSGWQPAFAAAALFALYPIHTEAIDWIAALPELGCTLFLLLAFTLYLRARHALSHRTLFVVASCLSFFCALLWKETAVIFPLLLLAAELLLPATPQPAARSLRRILAVAPSLAVLALYLGIRFAAIGGLESGRRDWQLDPLQFALNDLWLLVQYLGKLALPLWLNAYVTFHPIRSIADPRALAALAFFAALIAAIVLLLRRARLATHGSDTPRPTPLALALFGLAWTLLALLPALNLSALGRNAFTERYLFLPSFGFCLLLVVLASALLARLPESPRRYAAPALLGAVLIAFFTVTFLRNPDWRDDATLFATTLAQSPDSAFLHVMVASDQSNDLARTRDAETNFRAAIDLAQASTPPDRPDAVTAARGLAWIDANRGNLTQALAWLDNANAIDPTNADTDGERGLILLRAGQPAQAAPLLERALEAEPNNENVLSALGLLTRDGQHDPARAVSLFQRALAAHPAEDDFAAGQHNNLAAAYADLGNWPAAIAQEREAIRIQASDPEFHVNLAGALATIGHVDEARTEALTALQLSPNDPAAQSILSSLDQRSGVPALPR